MEDPAAPIRQFTSHALREVSLFLSRLASAADEFGRTGLSPQSMFDTPPQPAPRPSAPQAQPVYRPRPTYAAHSTPYAGHSMPAHQQSGPLHSVTAAAAAAAAAAPDTLAADEPKPKKRRRTERKFHRAPTGYNLFVRERLAQLKQNASVQFADSKEAFKAVVEEWRSLPEEERRHYLQQASSLATVPLDQTGLEDLTSPAAASPPASPSDSLMDPEPEPEPLQPEAHALRSQQRRRSTGPTQMQGPQQLAPPPIRPRATRSG